MDTERRAKPIGAVLERVLARVQTSISGTLRTYVTACSGARTDVILGDPGPEDSIRSPVRRHYH